MEVGKLIATLNSLRFGELETVQARLAEAGKACREIDQADLAAMLEEAETALDSADMKLFRKRVETVIARLGHLQ